MPNSIVNKVFKRVSAKNDRVMPNADLFGIGSRTAVRQALSRLVKQGKIVRVRRGLYALPRVSSLLGLEMPPPPDEMVHAWAKKNGLRVVPSGALAANLLGLSTQVPAKLIYYTNGRTKTLKFGQHTVKLLNRGPKTMDVRGQVSPLVFQALRYLGKKGMTPQVTARLTSLLKAKEKNELKRNLHRAAAWMKPVLEKIIEGRRS